MLDEGVGQGSAHPVLCPEIRGVLVRGLRVARLRVRGAASRGGPGEEGHVRGLRKGAVMLGGCTKHQSIWPQDD